MPETVSRDEIQSAFPRVAKIVADALGTETDKVRLESPLIEELHAESIDFLDIVYRLEREFKVKIPRGKILEDARGELSEAEFQVNGKLTDAGLRRLREHLSEVPPERIQAGLKVADIPRLFTVETFCKLVARQVRAGPA
jgi:acyl carrier protein